MLFESAAIFSSPTIPLSVLRYPDVIWDMLCLITYLLSDTYYRKFDMQFKISLVALAEGPCGDIINGITNAAGVRWCLISRTISAIQRYRLLRGRIARKFPHDTNDASKGGARHEIVAPWANPSHHLDRCSREFVEPRRWLSVQPAPRRSVSFHRGHVSLSTCSLMFVQGPQIHKQKSDNSEDGSDEEGPEDILQVD